MQKAIKAAVRAALLKLGLQPYYPPRVRADLSEADARIWEAVRPYTMTNLSRILAVCDAVRYVDGNGIDGDIVECGVWRGGSSMAAALTLTTHRHLHLFDTFEGMSAPTENDVRFDGATATDLLAAAADRRLEGNDNELMIGRASLEDVQRNMARTGYPADRIHYVRGKVEDTVPAAAPERIAILRLDTDWYESTLHELRHLYPRLAPSGILIIDDYGYWVGARKAVDEYFATLKPRPFLHRIDDQARSAVKL